MKSWRVIKVVFAVVFFIPMIIWGIICINHIKNINLVKNGEHIIADVYGYYSNHEENDVTMYKLEYKFEVAGKMYYGTTTASYDEFQIDEYRNGQIEICYNPITFDSIQADYSRPSIVIYILPICGLVSAIFWVSIIRDIIYFLRRKKVMKEGKVTKAMFVTAKNVVNVNHEPYYRVEYQYEDENKVSHNAKTRCDFNDTQMTYLKTLQKFDIKCIGKYSAIIEDLSDTKMAKTFFEEREEFEKAAKPEPKFKKCAFCGSLVDNDAKSCQNCGSRQFEKIEK